METEKHDRQGICSQGTYCTAKQDKTRPYTPALPAYCLRINCPHALLMLPILDPTSCLIRDISPTIVLFSPVSPNFSSLLYYCYQHTACCTVSLLKRNFIWPNLLLLPLFLSSLLYRKKLRKTCLYLIFHSLLQSGFCTHYCTRIALVQVTCDSNSAKSTANSYALST